MTIKFKDLFKKKTVKFDVEEKDEYDKKFERVNVKSTQVIDRPVHDNQHDELNGLSTAQLEVRLDRAKGKEKEHIKAILHSREKHK